MRMRLPGSEIKAGSIAWPSFDAQFSPGVQLPQPGRNGGLQLAHPAHLEERRPGAAGNIPRQATGLPRAGQVGPQRVLGGCHRTKTERLTRSICGEYDSHRANVKEVS